MINQGYHHTIIQHQQAHNQQPPNTNNNIMKQRRYPRRLSLEARCMFLISLITNDGLYLSNSNFINHNNSLTSYNNDDITVIEK